MIDLDRAKAHLRVDYDSEDSLIEAYLAAAIGTVEQRTGRILIQRELVQRLDAFPCGSRWDGYGIGHGRHSIKLHYDPVVSVAGIDYVASDGSTVTLLPDDGQFRTVEGEPYLLIPAVGNSWPVVLGGGGAVSVRYTAGYAEDEVPAPLEAAVLLMVGHLFTNREAVAVGVNVADMPMGVEMLTQPFRRVGLG